MAKPQGIYNELQISYESITEAFQQHTELTISEVKKWRHEINVYSMA